MQEKVHPGVEGGQRDEDRDKNSSDGDDEEEGRALHMNEPHTLSLVDRRGRSSCHLVCENLSADVKLLQWVLDKEFIKEPWKPNLPLKEPWYQHWEYGPRGSGYYLKHNGGTVPPNLWDGGGSGSEPCVHENELGTQLLHQDEAGMTPMHVLCSLPLSSGSKKEEVEAKKNMLKMLELVCKVRI